MNIDSVFPRRLSRIPGSNASSDECASVLGALFVRVYFERSVARRIGWRGILPHNAGIPAWTCRTAGSEHTFGLLFAGEEPVYATPSAQQTDKPREGIRGRFNVFLFPSPESEVLDCFPLAALSVALHDQYPEFVRQFASEHMLPSAAPFHIGDMYMELPLDGSGIAFRLEAPIRRRILSPEGVFAPTGECVIAPGSIEADYPAFRLALPLLAVLAQSIESIFDEPCRYSAGHRPWPDTTLAPTLCPQEQAGVLEHMHVEIGTSLHHAHRGAGFSRSLAALPLSAERAMQSVNEHRPVLHVLTGFLGSGKTTLLREWLNFLHDKNRFTGVLQNEFGQVGLDASLLKGEAVVEKLDEGCVCCSLADSLRPGLQRLLATLPAQECILETTGLANPEFIVEALEDLSDIVAPGLVITMVDALDISLSIASANPVEEHRPVELSGLRRAQIACADVLVVNKADTVAGVTLETMSAALLAINPRAEILFASWGRLPFARLDAVYEERKHPGHTSHAAPCTCGHHPAPSSLHTHEHHHVSPHMQEGYGAHLLEFDGPVARDDLFAALETSIPHACRIKGMVDILGEGPSVVQYAAGQLSVEPYTLEPEQCGYLVLIGKDVENMPEHVLRNSRWGELSARFREPA